MLLNPTRLTATVETDDERIQLAAAANSTDGAGVHPAPVVWTDNGGPMQVGRRVLTMGRTGAGAGPLEMRVDIGNGMGAYHGPRLTDPAGGFTDSPIVLGTARGMAPELQLDWGDGAVDTISLWSPPTSVAHTYPSAGDWLLTITSLYVDGLSGLLKRFGQNPAASKLLTVA